MNVTYKGKTFAIATLGCKVNQFESAEMVQKLKDAGWQQVQFNQQADLYLINSCTVTARSDAESRRLIRRARRANPKAKVVATGCYAQVAPQDVEKLPELDQVLGNEEKQELIQHLEGGRNSISNLTELKTAGALQLTSFSEHTRAFLQVQNGCNSRCSYCIVPFARGPSRSVEQGEILRSIAELVQKGYKEVVLTGIHLGEYGLDLPQPASLTSLVEAIEQQNLLPRLRLGSIEPRELTDQLLELFVSSTRLCQHLHIPLQSGSDTVLRRMGRNYDTSFYRSRIEAAIKLLPDAFIAADLIVGFPDENEAEFEETCRFINQLPLADLHIFPYSIRPGTKAATMPGHLKPAIIKARAEQLRQLAAAKLQQFRDGVVGQPLPVLGQQVMPDGHLSGLSRNYLDVIYPAPESMKNQEVMVRVERLEDGKLFGEIAGWRSEATCV